MCKVYLILQEEVPDLCTELQAVKRTAIDLQEINVFEKAVVLTDQPEVAAFCKNRGIYCCGYIQKKEFLQDFAFFPGVELVYGSPEAVSQREILQYARRFYGEPVILVQTDRLLIREHRETDLPDLQTLAREAGQWKYLLDPDQYAAYRKSYALFGYGYWTVEQEGKVIGICGFCSWERETSSEELCIWRKLRDESRKKGESFCLDLGYAIRKDLQRRGYAYEMCQAVIHFAFEELEADEIYVRIEKDNIASLGLARKLGFHS